MPQLDVTTYFSQLFWLGFFFILLLVVSTRFMLPRIAFIYNKRWEKTEGTREQALKLQQQAQQVQQTFEQHLLQARKTAQDQILNASKEIASSQEKAKADIMGHLKDQYHFSERKILENENVLMDQIQSIAQSLTTDIVQKVLNEDTLSLTVEKDMRSSMTKKIVGHYDF